VANRLVNVNRTVYGRHYASLVQRVDDI
jgi:hypothetical protein